LEKIFEHLNERQTYECIYQEKEAQKEAKYSALTVTSNDACSHSGSVEPVVARR